MYDKGLEVRVMRRQGKSDDFVHSITYGALFLWYKTGRFPKMAEAMGTRVR